MILSQRVQLTVIPKPVLGDMPEWAKSMSPGETKPISLNTMASCWEGPQPGGGGTIYKSVDAWNSGNDAPRLGPYGSKIFTGGGDWDGFDTAVYAFGYDTQRWTRIKNRTTALSWRPDQDKAVPVGHPQRFDRDYCEHGDGTPGAPHTYDLQAIDPEWGPHGALIRPLSRFVYPMDITNYAHRFVIGPDDAASKWERASTKAIGISREVLGMCDFDPTSKRVWVFGCTGSGINTSGLYFLDADTGVPSGVSMDKAYLIIQGCLRFWRGPHGNRRFLVWFQKGLPKIVDLDDVKRGVFSPPLEPTAIVAPMVPGHGFAWASWKNAFYLKLPSPSSQANVLYKITPSPDITFSPWRLEIIQLTGVGGTTNGLWKKFEADERTQTLTWYYKADGAVYAHRPA